MSNEVEIVRDAQGFAALESEWDELYRNSPLATPFQTWAWLYSWWEFYGEGYELRLITVRSDGGLLVGVAPFMLEHRFGFRRLLFVGTGLSRYLDVLAREGWEAQVGEVGRDFLQQLKSWHLVDLQQLRPESAAWHIFWRWEGPRAFVWQDDCLVIDAKPWDELLMSLPKSQRTPTRRTIRRAKEDGVHSHLAGQADTERAARRLVALSREHWGERWQQTHPEHWSRRLEAHLEVTARRMASCGVGGISELRRDGKLIVAIFLLFGRGSVGAYMAAASQEALRRYSFNTLFIWDMLNVARARNCTYLDLFQGDEPYKLRWKPNKVPNHRVVLGRSMAPWVSYAAYRALHSNVKRNVRSGDSPGWIRDVESKYHTLRSRTTWYLKSVKESGISRRVKGIAERLRGS